MSRPRCCSLFIGLLALGPTLRSAPAAPSPPPASSKADETISLADVIVTPSRFGVADQAATTSATLTASELEAMPQLGDDLFRTITRLPGLAADDFTAEFWVRGAPNSEVLARLDGVQLIEPFHLKDVDGALSIVDLSTIGKLDLITGGFTANYGDRLAGVLDMETKTGPALRAMTTLDLNLTGLSGSNEGVSSDGKWRWLAAGRRGYPDLALRVEHKEDEIDPRYYDVTGKIEYQPNDANTLSLHVLHAYDALTYHHTGDPDLSSRYLSDYVWSRWQGNVGEHLLGEAVLSMTQLTWQRYGSGPFDGFPLSLQDNRRLDLYDFRNDWTLSLTEHFLVRGGIDLGTGYGRYDYALTHSLSNVSNGKVVTQNDAIFAHLRPGGDTLGAFLAPRYQPWKALILEPSLRFDRHVVTHDSDWSPRLNATLNFGAWTFRAAWGNYAQSEGLQEIAVEDGERTFHKAEQAEHRILSAERPIGGGVDIRVEAYERLTSHVRPRYENAVNPYEVFPEVESDVVLLSPAKARARGIELLAEQRTGKEFTWSASYARASSEQDVIGVWIPVARDERDTLRGELTWTPNSKWQYSGSWQYHTGWPTTNVVYAYVPLSNGGRFLQQTLGPVYGVRLPAYHRLDLRATRVFRFDRSSVRAYLDVFNAYDQQNIVGYDYSALAQGSSVATTTKPRKLLPILPSAGITWSF